VDRWMGAVPPIAGEADGHPRPAARGGHESPAMGTLLRVRRWQRSAERSGPPGSHPGHACSKTRRHPRAGGRHRRSHPSIIAICRAAGSWVRAFARRIAPPTRPFLSETGGCLPSLHVLLSPPSTGPTRRIRRCVVEKGWGDERQYEAFASGYLERPRDGSAGACCRHRERPRAAGLTRRPAALRPRAAASNNNTKGARLRRRTRAA